MRIQSPIIIHQAQRQGHHRPQQTPSHVNHKKATYPIQNESKINNISRIGTPNRRAVNAYTNIQTYFEQQRVPISIRLDEYV